MLFHHDSHKSYTEAASEAAKHARTIMEKKFEGGVAKGKALLDFVEDNIPDDYIVKSNSATSTLTFSGSDSNKLVLNVGHIDELKTFDLHKNAVAQFSKRVGGPGNEYLLDKLAGEPWRVELAAHTLNTFMRNAEPKRFLLRSVKDQVRAALSDNYKRYDSRPIAHAFIDTVQNCGAYVTDGVGTDMRYNFKAFIPVVFEPVPNEVMCFGVEITNSDFGGARYVLRMVMWRLWCTNYATLECGLKEVHLGGKLPEDIALSTKTMQLDTATMISATQDVIRGFLSPAKINTAQELIKRANEQEISWDKAKTILTKHFSKDELANAKDMFEDTSDNVLMALPKVRSVYKVSQILGYQAGKTTDNERKLDLEAEAGKLLMSVG